MDRRRSSHIVPEIYEATVNPGHWDYVLAMIAKLTCSQSALIYYHNQSNGQVNTIAEYSHELDFQIGTSTDYLSTLCDLFGNNGFDSNSAYAQFSAHSDDNYFIDPEFRDHWLEQNGMHHVGGALLGDHDALGGGLIMFRDQDNGEWDDGEIRVVNEILPHLRKAFSIHTEMTLLRVQQEGLLQGLDRLVIGLMLYDKNAEPVYLNPTARAIVNEHPAFTMSGDEPILLNPEDRENLRETIIKTAHIEPDDSWSQSVAIGINHPDVEAPLPILVTPIHANMITSDLEYEGAKVALFISDPNRQQPISSENLSSVYGLSRSEAHVAISIANGHNIEEIARLSNHSIHTIRSQLKSIFRKVGVSRQSELIKLLLSGPFAHRRKS